MYCFVFLEARYLGGGSVIHSLCWLVRAFRLGNYVYNFQGNNEIVLISLPKDALAACNYLPQSREKIIAALFKALNSTNSELQEAGEACMRKVSECTCVCTHAGVSSAFPFTLFVCPEVFLVRIHCTLIMSLLVSWSC